MYGTNLSAGHVCMTEPFISVIIPYLNQPEHLPVCLKSLKAQAYPPNSYEIIVVDNGSASPPTDICAAYANVKLDHEATAGPGPARNRGISVSRGELLAFIDADCIADPGWLSAIAATLKREDGPRVIGGDVRIAIADPEHPTMLEAYESIYAYRQEEYITRKGFSGTGNLAMRRPAYEAVGPFAGIEVAEDREWGHRATSKGYAIGYVPTMIVYHPARKSFAELLAKWDRHVSHDFEEYAQGFSGRLRWLGLAVAVAGSPLFEMWRILSSRRVATWRERWLATIAMTRIRFYRARVMIVALFGGSAAGASRGWNRD